MKEANVPLNAHSKEKSRFRGKRLFSISMKSHNIWLYSLVSIILLGLAIWILILLLPFPIENGIAVVEGYNDMNRDLLLSHNSKITNLIVKTKSLQIVIS